MNAKIYALQDEFNQIRYIGKTIHSLDQRVRQHIRDAIKTKKNVYRLNWIRSLLLRGFSPRIMLIGEAGGSGAKEEIAWITYGKLEGWRLVNLTDGGEGNLGRKLSPETIAKMVIFRTGKKASKATRRRLRLSHLGHKDSPETKEKKRLKLLGRVVSDATREKIRLIHLGTHPSKKTLKILSLTHQGHIVPQDVRDKIGNSIKNNPKRMEHARQLGLSWKGKKGKNGGGAK